MLATPTEDPVLPAGHAAEPKWDGFRALVGCWADGHVQIRSRSGGDLTAAFPEIAIAAAGLPAGTALDGEFVIWEHDRLAFERLQQRLHRRGSTAARAAAQWPAHYVAFDLLRLDAVDLTATAYRDRRAALEALFANHGLQAPWALCPATTDPRQTAEWLSWTAVGMEGLVFKRLDQTYRPGWRGWRKYRSRHSTEALIGAVTGTLSAPVTALLGRLDAGGQLQYVGRTTVLHTAARQALGARLRDGHADHPWTGWSFSAGWGSQDQLDVRLADPVIVAEVAVDVSLDSAGRWRHPVRLLRVRTDLAASDVPPLGTDKG
ncbi:ATP-dependent DNA ligase [Streptomyces sp. WM6378]|uniref:ATP-dependent DNA ligase n=1 Tax=Streptomyces sp. WM6378 TaxID=1415557 RepID=UPI0006C6908B|nr:ATP-dependent DNA ligase [Streptomyces sp. WM6378]KOU50078.1 ATP-dependent DNA ligase [Streptomyces sp. WM6378]